MKCVICALIKDELDHLEEWILHNLEIGFSDIFLYEDFGSKSHKSITDKYPLVHLENFDSNIPKVHSHKLVNLFTYFAKKYKDKYDWCVFIDPDEYIKFSKRFSLDKLKRYNRFTGILIQLKTYGANGHIYKPLGNLLDNFNGKPQDFHIKGYNIKTIANLRKADTIKFIRSMHVIKGAVTAPIVSLWYDHYYTKSWEEWVDRFISRGDALPGNTVPNYFFYYNLDMINIFLDDFMKTNKGLKLLDYFDDLLKKYNDDYSKKEQPALGFYLTKLFYKLGVNFKLGQNVKAKYCFSLVSIGNNVSIGDNLNLIDDLPIKIGNNVVIGDNVTIYGGAIIPDNSNIPNNSVIK